MNVTAGILGVVVLLLLVGLRVPVAVALVLVSGGGLWLLLGPAPAMGVLANTPMAFAASWTLSAVPMFLLMGLVAYHAGLTASLFAAAKRLLGRLPGGLAISTVFACTGFAAVSGSSIANSAAMGRIAVPEMIRAGIRPDFACGCVAAGGTIGALIPPSILMIVYGVFTETSVTKLFLAGVGVGLVTALGYAAVILLHAFVRPDVVPRGARPAAAADGTADEDASGAFPVLVLVAVIFGGLFGGLFTPTEAGAVGALAAFLLAFSMRRLDARRTMQAVEETLLTCAALFVVAIGAAMFTRFLGITGVSGFLAQQVQAAGLEGTTLVLLLVFVYLVLGMFMEPFGAMLITLPVILPLLRAQGVDPIWFGALVVKLLEIGMITPPVGLNVFVIRSVVGGIGVAAIFRGVVPFLAADLVVVALLVAFPPLATFLPRLLG